MVTMRSFIASLLSTALIAIYSVASAQSMTPQQYHKEKGACACPDDKDKAGSKCGKRSAFCQKGGVEIKGCFRVDVAKRTKEACG
jgi:hypothetical protein